MLDPGFEGYKREKAGSEISPGAALQADYGGKVNLRLGGEEKPAAQRVRTTEALEV